MNNTGHQCGLGILLRHLHGLEARATIMVSYEEGKITLTDESVNQPSIDEWKFIDQLKAPLHTPFIWRRTRKGRNEVDLRKGVSLAWQFSDPAGRLDTACDDFNRFLVAAGIPSGAYPIITAHTNTECDEEYLIEIHEGACLLRAQDTEGIRRALVALEDRITSTGGPFLPYGTIHRKPFIRTRITRCFFGPLKRPPLQRDELLDDINYYPDEYLNRLAHEGINALWLSISFRDLCPSRFSLSMDRMPSYVWKSCARPYSIAPAMGLKSMSSATSPRDLATRSGLPCQCRASRQIPNLRGTVPAIQRTRSRRQLHLFLHLVRRGAGIRRNMYPSHLRQRP